ncbi:hypothetical protein ACFFV7_03600 [Nonomuraea spiralis]|uniref:Uncharacterized protein n=2 Tax=Nonomuraea spiralis TaxID=46182 RepID=A0ABV5I6V6_9ACTN|nr:hypothetical protein [Nonomuraea spiralis]
MFTAALAQGAIGARPASAADSTCGSWTFSNTVPGLMGRACIRGAGANWKQAVTEVYNGSGAMQIISPVTAYLDPLNDYSAAYDVIIRQQETRTVTTRIITDANPFQFDRAEGSFTVGPTETVGFVSPWVG